MAETRIQRRPPQFTSPTSPVCPLGDLGFFHARTLILAAALAAAGCRETPAPSPPARRQPAPWREAVIEGVKFRYRVHGGQPWVTTRSVWDQMCGEDLGQTYCYRTSDGVDVDYEILFWPAIAEKPRPTLQRRVDRLERRVRELESRP